VNIRVMHFGVVEKTNSNYHARPSIVGKVAQEAGVKTLVLSHFIKRGNLEISASPIWREISPI
jgi:ribonuclease BN (tRNA processing enzyme)